MLAIAQTDDQRTAGTRHHQMIGIIGTNHGQRISPHQLCDRGAHRFQQSRRMCEQLGEQMGNYLGIRFRGKHVAFCSKFGAQLGVVFNDAVVDDCHLLTTHVRVGIALCRHAMGCPARMRDTQ